MWIQAMDTAAQQNIPIGQRIFSFHTKKKEAFLWNFVSPPALIYFPANQME